MIDEYGHTQLKLARSGFLSLQKDGHSVYSFHGFDPNLSLNHNTVPLQPPIMRRPKRNPQPKTKKNLSQTALLTKQVAELEKEVAALRHQEAHWVKQLDNAVESAVRTTKDQLDQNIIALKVENQQLGNQLQSLQPLVTIGIDIRMRLITQAKSQSEPGDADIIKRGNCAAHRGRPLADAMLCEQELKPHEGACDDYMNLYGVYPSWMLDWADTAMVNDVLECRGSLVAERIPLSEKFEDLFCQLINHITAEDHREAVASDRFAVTTSRKIYKEYNRLVAASEKGWRMLRIK